MNTITLNADEHLDEGGQDNKKFELNDKAKATMAAGLGGVALGAGVKAAVDALNNEPKDGPVEQPEKQDHHVTASSQTSAPSQPTETVSAAEVNPDEVMLEEPVLESNLEDPMVELTEEAPEYQPFANNDVIEDIVYEGPLSDEPLYAENTHTSMETEEVTVDLICGEPNYQEEPTDELHYQPDEQYAWEPESYDETDVQSDLMA